MKTCSKCGEEKPVRAFPRAKNTCRECDNKRRFALRRERPLVELLATTRRRAEDRKFGFNLDLDYLERLWSIQSGLCFHFKIPLVIDGDAHADSPAQVSIDRLDNRRGYVKGNVALTCFAANLARNKFTQEEFAAFCRTLPFALTSFPRHQLDTLMRKLADPRPVLISGDEDVVSRLHSFLRGSLRSTPINSDGVSSFVAHLAGERAEDLYLYLKREGITRALAIDVQGGIHHEQA